MGMEGFKVQMEIAGAIPNSKGIRPAASLLVPRDTGNGLEVLTLKRASTMRFLPGYLAFPGGALDEADADIASERWRGGLLARDNPDDPVFAVTAVRECAEETGWLFPVCDDQGRVLDGPLETMEQAELLEGNVDFRVILARRGAYVDGSRIRRVGRWVTPPHSAIRFDTRFFLVSTQSTQHAPLVHGSESTWVRWEDPARLLAGIEQAKEHAVPPTIAMLHGLRACGNVATCWEALNVPGPPGID